MDTPGYNFEIKTGKSIKKIQDWINQAVSQKENKNLTPVLFKPDREDPLVILTFKDFYKLCEKTLEK